MKSTLKKTQNGTLRADSLFHIEFMNEYELLDHMAKVDEINNAEIFCYLPHQGILREDSLTTKLRIVFNASATTTSSYSLNDLQMVGPTIQEDLLSILLRVRKHTFVISADVAKMYRQVSINPKQRSLQRILWRKSL